MFGLGKKYINVYKPCKGKVVSINEVPDKVFSEKMLGEGFAVIPEDSKITSPVDGVITTIFPTNHAFGIETSNGTEILVHIGIDTVELKGDGFKRILEPGSNVKVGETVIDIDIEKIKKNGKEIITPVVFTNISTKIKFTDNKDGVIVKIEK